MEIATWSKQTEDSNVNCEKEVIDKDIAKCSKRKVWKTKEIMRRGNRKGLERYYSELGTLIMKKRRILKDRWKNIKDWQKKQLHEDR